MDSKAFRGESGEIVRGFLSAGTWLTAIPVAGATLLLGMLASFLHARLGLPAAFTIPASLALLAPITGLFAMAARAGQERAGFLEALAGHGGRGALGFALRYGLLQAAWSVPLVLVAMKAAPWLVREAAGGAGSMTLAIWAGVALASAALLLPSLTLLVATRTDTVAEAFSAEAWSWLLRERRADIVPFLAAALGGMTLFLLAALPVLAILLPTVVEIAPELGAGLALALPAVPWATAPILLGRLAGAFVASEPLPEAASPSQPTPQANAPRTRGPATFDVPVPHASRTVASLAASGLVGLQPGAAQSMRLECPTSVQPIRDGGAQGVPLGVAIARAHQLAETDTSAALAELESLRAAHPRNPAIIAELARLLRRLGRQEEAVMAAATAIRLALNGGAGPIAHDVFRAFAQDAAAMHLEPAIYEQLARILSARREFDGAAWCYRAAAALGGEPRSLQKGMLAVAETALEGGHFEKAAAVYDTFMATWPDSPLVSFARDGAEDARRRQMASTATT